MSAKQNNTGEILEPEMEQALRDFRSNVYAWSEAAYSRPRRVARVEHGGSWRLATSWALAAVLAVGGVTGGMLDRHHHQQMEKIAAAQQAARQRQLAAEREYAQQAAQMNNEDLLATVDNDLSRRVPSAMEPLAQLMDGDSSE